MTKDHIKDILLAGGNFKEKLQSDGTYDLNPYVCPDVARVVLIKLGQITADMTDLIDSKDTLESQQMLDRCEDIIERHIKQLEEIK